MVDDPAHHFAEFAESGADSVTFHVEATDDPAGVAAAARAHGLAVGVAFNPETSPSSAAAFARAAGAEHRPLHEHPSRVLGPGVHAGGARADRRARARSSTSRSRSTAASARRMRGASARPARALLVAAAPSSPTPIRPPRTGASSPPRRHEPRRARSSSRSAAAAPRYPNPTVGAVVVSPAGDVVGEGVHRARRGSRHGEVVALDAAGDAARAARRST